MRDTDIIKHQIRYLTPAKGNLSEEIIEALIKERGWTRASVLHLFKYNICSAAQAAQILGVHPNSISPMCREDYRKISKGAIYGRKINACMLWNKIGEDGEILPKKGVRMVMLDDLFFDTLKSKLKL